MQIFNKKDQQDRRKYLRNNASSYERSLWFAIKGRQLGVKFRRQHGIGPYIADFYCASRRLVIELDGDSHVAPDAERYDRVRDAYMIGLGLTVLRFTNGQVDSDLEGVIEVIRRTLGQPPLTPPSKGGGSSGQKV